MLAEFKTVVKLKYLILIILMCSLGGFEARAGQITFPYTYSPNDTVTNIKLNGNNSAISNVVNGGLDNNNANTTSGYRFYQTVAVLPAAGSQGAVYFLTSDNSLNFDTGGAFSKSVSVTTPLNNQAPVYNGSAWIGTDITALKGLTPIGGIIMWSGSIVTIPTNWHLCDGTNGTPNLTNRFIVGADADVGGVAKSTITGSALQTSEGQLPATTTSAITFSKFFSATAPAPSIGGDGINNFLNQTVSFGTGTANVARFYALAYIQRIA